MPEEKKQEEIEDINFDINEAYAPYLDLDSSIQIFFGGGSSGKSHFALSQRVLYQLFNGKNHLIVRKVKDTLRDSVFNQIKKAINDLSPALQKQFKILENTMTITCKKNKKQIVFKGLDDVNKLKSITPLNGNFDYIIIEEATEITENDLTQLRIRLRGKDLKKETEDKKIIVLLLNPILKTHWIFTKFFTNWIDGQNIYHTPELFILKTTYKDNAFLTEDDVTQLLSIEDEYHKKVYVEGEWGTLSEVIFKNWRVEDLASFIPIFDNIRNGVDFGYTPSPFAFARCHLDTKRKKLYIFKSFYLYGVQNEEAARRVKEIIRNERLICDSEAPKDIDDFKIKGINAVGAKKGPGSVEFSIKWLQGYEIIIDISCQDAINEFTLLRRAKDKHGNTLEKIVGKRHIIDAVRYSLEDDMNIGCAVAIPQLIISGKTDLSRQW